MATPHHAGILATPLSPRSPAFKRNEDASRPTPVTFSPLVLDTFRTHAARQLLTAPDKEQPVILHVALQNESANLARLADTLADEQLEDGDYDEATFDRIISDTTALAVRLLDHVGDHIAADAVRAS